MRIPYTLNFTLEKQNFDFNEFLSLLNKISIGKLGVYSSHEGILWNSNISNAEINRLFNAEKLNEIIFSLDTGDDGDGMPMRTIIREDSSNNRRYFISFQITSAIYESCVLNTISLMRYYNYNPDKDFSLEKFDILALEKVILLFLLFVKSFSTYSAFMGYFDCDINGYSLDFDKSRNSVDVTYYSRNFPDVNHSLSNDKFKVFDFEKGRIIVSLDNFTGELIQKIIEDFMKKYNCSIE